ncbi:MurR/RpiR family transcriptional regulator [Fundicoccus sp. Sow4_F4]|uniref:MurR/RpiR family transcriptional regulator n=1 Tax=Fundicoccus sp. Sow4_F4 TaxID=3438783 RepID=UPI003F90F6F2
MKKGFLKLLIRNNLHLFSKTDKKLADYFLELNEELVNKTIANLSTETDISQTTIFNFVKKLGFEGFQDFKITLATNIISDDKKESENSINIYSDITSQDSASQIADKIINFNKNSLDTLKETLDREKLENVINLLSDIENIHFYGLGGSSIVAYDSFHKFMRSKYNCDYIIDYHLQLGYSAKLKKNDAVFLFSHSGYSIEAINIAKQINKSEATLITLTGNPGSELVSYADESLIVISEESKFRSESLSSRILYLTVMDIINTAIMYKDEIENQASFDMLRDALAVTRTDKIK